MTGTREVSHTPVAQCGRHGAGASHRGVPRRRGRHDPREVRDRRLRDGSQRRQNPPEFKDLRRYRPGRFWQGRDEVIPLRERRERVLEKIRERTNDRSKPDERGRQGNQGNDARERRDRDRQDRTQPPPVVREREERRQQDQERRRQVEPSRRPEGRDRETPKKNEENPKVREERQRSEERGQSEERGRSEDRSRSERRNDSSNQSRDREERPGRGR